MNRMDYQVERVEVAEQPTAVVRAVIPAEEIPAFLGRAYAEVLEVIAAQHLTPAGMPFGCFVPTEDGMEVEAGFPCSGPVVPARRVMPASIPGGPAARVLHQGSYDGVRAAHAAATQWLADNGWEAAGPPWEEYLDGPGVAEPRTVVYVPCRTAQP